MVSVRKTSVAERSGRPTVTAKGNAKGRAVVNGSAAQEKQETRSKRGILDQLKDFGSSAWDTIRSIPSSADGLIDDIQHKGPGGIVYHTITREIEGQVEGLKEDFKDIYGEGKVGKVAGRHIFDLMPLPGFKGLGRVKVRPPRIKSSPSSDHVPPKQKTEKEKKGERQKSCTNQPVVFATGAKALHTAEFAFGWTIGFALYRNYASDLDFAGPLGRNRIGPLDETIVRLDDGTLLLQMGSGLSAAFATPTPVPGHYSRNAKHPHLKLAAGERRSLIVKAGGNKAKGTRTGRRSDDGRSSAIMEAGYELARLARYALK